MKKNPIPRPEYPRMQLRREQAWMNLNGVWDFHIDAADSGVQRGVLAADTKAFDRKIVVPFCPESKLSGIEHKDFMNAVFYRRKVTFPAAWKGKRILLNFGGVDFRAAIYLDGAETARHLGGSSPFTVDVTRWAKPGKAQTLLIHVRDDVRTGEQGGGKQSQQYASSGCCYTRVTGIWQTVWAEAVDPSGILSLDITPNYDAACVVFQPRMYALAAGATLHVEVRAGKKVVATSDTPAANAPVPLAMPKDFRAWSPSDPFLYDATLTVRDAKGRELDRVETYFAMRKVSCEGGRFLLNNKPIFLRLVLDQGFYPDGIWTAPSDAELKRDIQRSMAMGFNGARLHQKVFEDRFHYWADRLGYLTWSEFASWQLNVSLPGARATFLAEWPQIVAALRSHPSIIAWSPHNETAWANGGANPNGGSPEAWAEYRAFIRNIYTLTKALDPTRPVNDSSGYIHVQTDLWTTHDYTATAEELKARLLPEKQEKLVFLPHDQRVEANFAMDDGFDGTQPWLVDEWGGFRYVRAADRKKQKGPAWGYHGLKFENDEEFLARIREQLELMISIPEIAGHCYTQLTDVEQEQNGVYTYGRKPKVPAAEMAKVMGMKPAWSAW